MAKKKLETQPLFTESDWTFESMGIVYEAIQDIALNDLSLDVYPNQIEIISSEQMLDAYSSIGLPLMYQHWSFGKRFVRDETMYRKGMTGLAYEIVINSNPCISYNMEENTMALQTLVMAHAAFGHNHFFKNNYLFKQWTDADGILDYISFAKNFIMKCEERYGFQAVEDLLDAAHSLMSHGVFRYRRPPRPTKEELEAMRRMRESHEEKQSQLDIWMESMLNPSPEERELNRRERVDRQSKMNLPEENLLYFFEKNSPVLEPWQQEILRIVRSLAQYLYPQKQTKVMNEGCATFVHYYIINRLHDQGLITDGAFMEMLHSHTNVVMQPDFDDPRFSGINPYTLGFNMMMDIKRICEDPTDEDREWFPDFAGSDDWRSVLKHAWANYRDESFIQQFLSPHLMRKMKLFVITDDSKKDELEVTEIHSSRHYKKLRQTLANSYDITNYEANIQVMDADLKGDRILKLRHGVHNGILLEDKSRDEVLKYVKYLWGYDVTLDGHDQETDQHLYSASTIEEKVEPGSKKKS
ncbi:SpoVR family protein [Aestuariispira insulae]|uniref:Stage V sporulation protein R n=1 Tax=Aestuariispira insulae TaxID=1461337 RepID=A0A3D9HGQ3_9PROT|nr:SpoVR family protein [Aestuariispira insulae]RED48669.1 stage V sporulation protein R [Aestuariispira insulae]